MSDEELEAIAAHAYEIAGAAAEYYGDFNWLWEFMEKEPKAGFLAFARAILESKVTECTL